MLWICTTCTILRLLECRRPRAVDIIDGSQRNTFHLIEDWKKLSNCRWLAFPSTDPFTCAVSLRDVIYSDIIVANPSLSPIGTSLLSLYISEQFPTFIRCILHLHTSIVSIIRHEPSLYFNRLWARRYTRRNLTMNTTFFLANTHQVCESHGRNRDRNLSSSKNPSSTQRVSR